MALEFDVNGHRFRQEPGKDTAPKGMNGMPPMNKPGRAIMPVAQPWFDVISIAT